MFKVGDLVKLASTRPDNWNKDGQMDRWLGATIRIKSIDARNGRDYFTFNDKESSRWAFRIDEIEGYADPEQQAEYLIWLEQERIRKEEERKNCIYKTSEIAVIAQEIFGEERVDYDTHSIRVHFPEITITNSKDMSHCIKDLYVNFEIHNIDFDNEFKADIDLSGCRTTLSLKEYKSDYGHSHFNGGGFCSYRRFCLGASDFKILLTNLRMTLSKDDWFLMFYSLENYLNWESLEGGPYRKIENITLPNDTSSSTLKEEALRLFYGIPDECFSYNEGLQIIEEHPSLFDYYRENSRIKTLSNSNEQALLQEALSSLPSGIYFKKKKITPVIYHGEEVKEFDKEVANRYNGILKQHLKEFNQNYGYKIAKQSRNQEIFGEVGTFQ